MKARNRTLAVYGVVIIAFILGSLFSLKLITYGYFIIIAATFIVGDFLIAYTTKQKITTTRHVAAVIGGLLLFFFLGMQTPQVPFKIYLLVIGVVLIVPALLELLRKIYK